MQVIQGQSEKGMPRLLQLTKQGAEELRVEIRHPTGQSGAVVQVSSTELLGALKLRQQTIQGVAPFAGRPLQIRRVNDLRDEYYLWIQDVAQNGWSIFVGASDLTYAVEDELAGVSPSA